MTETAGDLARRLAENAEAFCRYYLSNGCRHGAYWQVGDVFNNPGRSMFVRLRESAKGRAGKWIDGATGDHGDLLDVIRAVHGLADFRDVAEEARCFLSLPQPELGRGRPVLQSARLGSAEAARRLWAISQPIPGTIAETYLRRRGIVDCCDLTPLRFHQRADGIAGVAPIAICAKRPTAPQRRSEVGHGGING